MTLSKRFSWKTRLNRIKIYSFYLHFEIKKMIFFAYGLGWSNYLEEKKKRLCGFYMKQQMPPKKCPIHDQMGEYI